MQIFLLRHGIPEPAQAGRNDSDRSLLPEAGDPLRAVLGAARAAGVQPTLIMTSPYRRAVETAKMARAEFGYTGDILRSDALRPGCGPEEIWSEIRTHKSEEHILLVGSANSARGPPSGDGRTHKRRMTS